MNTFFLNPGPKIGGTMDVESDEEEVVHEHTVVSCEQIQQNSDNFDSRNDNATGATKELKVGVELTLLHLMFLHTTMAITFIHKTHAMVVNLDKVRETSGPSLNRSHIPNIMMDGIRSMAMCTTMSIAWVWIYDL